AARAARAADDAAIFPASVASAAATSLPRSFWARRRSRSRPSRCWSRRRTASIERSGDGFGGFMGAGESPRRAEKWKARVYPLLRAGHYLQWAERRFGLIHVRPGRVGRLEEARGVVRFRIEGLPEFEGLRCPADCVDMQALVPHAVAERLVLKAVFGPG